MGVVRPEGFEPPTKKFGAHMFRRTYATNLLRSGFTLRDVQHLLGHKNNAVTEVYLHQLQNEDLSDKLLNSIMASMYTPETKITERRKGIHVVSEGGAGG